MIERAPTAEDFLQHTESFRNAHPMETNILGSVATSVAKGTKSYSECFWWVVLQRDEVVGIAMRTAPYRLLLSPMPLNAIRELSLAVLERDTGFWGVTGPEECATEFIGCWCEQTDRQKSDYPQHMRETLYVLGEHTPHPKVSGKARKGFRLSRRRLASFTQSRARQNFARHYSQPPTLFGKKKVDRWRFPGTDRSWSVQRAARVG
jgi:predicted GNAT family acetyltransferase